MEKAIVTIILGLILTFPCFAERQKVITVSSGSGSGDVTAVGDCATGACFSGTSGTTLTFNNAGGDKTLDYDGTDFLFNAPLSVDATDPADTGAIRLDNAENIAWEASPAGTDYTLGVDASEILQASGAVNAAGAITGSNLSGTNTGDNTVATTGDSATSFFSSGTLEVAIGGTGTTTSTGTGAVVLGTSPTFTTDITFPAGSIEAGAYGAATIDGDDIASSLAGRSLTLTAASPDTLDADAELYTIRFNAGIENPVAADDDIIQIEPAGAFTITEVACSTDTGTATINFNENVNTTPNTAGTAILSADIVCDTNRQSSCASGCDVNTISNGGIAAGNLISIITTSVASTPTKLRIHIKGTIDD